MLFKFCGIDVKLILWNIEKREEQIAILCFILKYDCLKQL